MHRGFTSQTVFAGPPYGSVDYTNLTSSPEDFKVFVSDLYNHFLHSEKGMRDVNHHMRPVSMQCGIPEGVQYNFVLKVEEIDVWYPDLISMLGLEEPASSGWQRHREHGHPQQVNSANFGMFLSAPAAPPQTLYGQLFTNGLKGTEAGTALALHQPAKCHVTASYHSADCLTTHGQCATR